MPTLRTALCTLLLLNAALQAATPVVPDDDAAVQLVMAQLKEIRTEVQGRPIDAALTRGGFTVLTSEPQFEIVFAEGWGDCESGCINHRYTYFVVTPEGKVQQAGEYGNIKADDVVSGEPMWGVPSVAKSEVTDDVEKLKEYALSPRWWLREYALRSLGESGDKVHAGLARDALNDKHPRVRIAAIQALWIFGGDDNMRVLLTLLQDPRPEVRQTVLYSLEKAKDPQIFAGLLKYLNSDDPLIVNIVFGTLAKARYLPAMKALNDVVLLHADFTPAGIKHLGERLYFLSEWARPESVPAFIQSLKFTDETYEANLAQENENTRFMTAYGMFYGTALTGLARVSGESVDNLLPLSITPRDRKRVVTHWEKWWEQHGPEALASAGRELDLESIKQILSDRDDQRQSTALDELRRKLADGSIHIADVAPVLLRYQSRCGLWSLQEKDALQWLARAAQSVNTTRSNLALSELRAMDTLESWRAMLQCRSHQDAIQETILQAAWSSLCAAYASPRDKKFRQLLQPELHAMIEAALQSGLYKSTGTAQTLAGLEKIPFDAAAVKARVDAEQKAHPFDEFSTRLPALVDRARRHDPELKQELLAMLAHPQPGMRELALYELMRRYAYTPSAAAIISLVHLSRSTWSGGLSRNLLKAASACAEPELLQRMQEVLRDEDRSEEEELSAFWILCDHGVAPDPALCQSMFARAVNTETPDGPNAGALQAMRTFRPPGFTVYLQHCAARFAAHKWPRTIALLNEFDPPSAEAAVARSLEAITSEEQAVAARTAGKLKLQRLLPNLKALAAADEPPLLRAAVLEALAAMPSPELEADLLKDAAGSWQVRRAAIGALIAIDYDRHRKLLYGLLSGRDDEQEFALREIANHRDTEAAPIVLAFVRAGTAGDEALKDWKKVEAGLGLTGRLAGATTIQQDGTVLSVESFQARESSLVPALHVLALLKYRAALPELERIAAMNSPLSRSATQAIGEFDDTEKTDSRPPQVTAAPQQSLQTLLDAIPNPPADLSYHTIIMALTSPEHREDAAVAAALELQDDFLVQETHEIMNRLGALRDARVEPLAKRWVENCSLQWEGKFAVLALLRINPAKYTQQALTVLSACRDDDAHVLLQQIRRYCGTEIVPGLRAWVAETPQRESLKNEARDAINALLQK